MLAPTLFSKLWSAMLLWGIIYLSDYYMTLLSARMRVRYAYPVEIEGSYELTPGFQKDIDTLNPVSRRFIAFWLLTQALIALFWWMAKYSNQPDLYQFFLGILILLEVSVHLRHFRNIATFWLNRDGLAIQGHVKYRRWYGLKLSALELWTMAILWLALASLSNGWFFGGGALSCTATGLRHWLDGRWAAGLRKDNSPDFDTKSSQQV